MTNDEFEGLALDLLEATMNIAAQQKISADQLIREHQLLVEAFEKGEDVPRYESKAACIAYAFRYGIQTAFEAWSVLKKGPINSKIGNITILGGGCCFELAVLVHFLKEGHKELHVKVIEPVAHWKIFQPMLVRYAEREGVRLHLDFVPVIDLLEQIDSYKTDLLVSFNGLTELSFGERKALRIAYATCNRHIIWHSSLSVMQDVFCASFIPRREVEKFPFESELSEFLEGRFPGLAKLNVFANLGQKGFYLMHNLVQPRHVNASHWASRS